MSSPRNRQQFRGWIGFYAVLKGLGLGVSILAGIKGIPRSNLWAGRVAKNGLIQGCRLVRHSSFWEKVGSIPREPQDEIENILLGREEQPRFVFFVGPRGSGKSFFLSEILEKRNEYYVPLRVCYGEDSISENVLGEVLGLHPYRFQNAWELFEKSIRSEYEKNGERTLIVVEDPGSGVENGEVGLIQNMLDLHHHKCCDVIISMCESQAPHMSKSLKGSHGLETIISYIPPTETSLTCTIQASIDDGTLSTLTPSSLSHTIPYIGSSHLTDLGHVLQSIEGGATPSDAIDSFRVAQHNFISSVAQEILHDERTVGLRSIKDVQTLLLSMLNIEESFPFLSAENVEDELTVDFLVRNRVWKMENGGYTWRKKGVQRGAESYLKSP